MKYFLVGLFWNELVKSLFILERIGEEFEYWERIGEEYKVIYCFLFVVDNFIVNVISVEIVIRG